MKKMMIFLLLINGCATGNLSEYNCIEPWIDVEFSAIVRANNMSTAERTMYTSVYDQWGIIGMVYCTQYNPVVERIGSFYK